MDRAFENNSRRILTSVQSEAYTRLLRGTKMSSRKTSILLLLTIWFAVWGICPWNNASAVAEGGKAAHAHHGHQGDIDDTHHASKGVEHSCSGSISYSTTFKGERPYEHVAAFQDPLLITEPAIPLTQNNSFQKLLIERNTLPKLLSEYFQLYSVYRI